MKFILFSSLCFLLLNCNSSSKKKIKISSNFQVDTLTINHQKYLKFFVHNRFSCLTNFRGDTIVPFENFYHQIEIIDFNEDRLMDLRVFIMSNSSNQCNNYIYDTISKSFKFIKNCNEVFEKISAKNYYFTYFSNGCAGQNFGSYLSKLENFTFVDLAYIKEYGCDFDTVNSPKRVEVFSISSDSSKTLKPLKRFSNEKFVGVDEYWKENFLKLDELFKLQ